MSVTAGLVRYLINKYQVTYRDAILFYEEETYLFITDNEISIQFAFPFSWVQHAYGKAESDSYIQPLKKVIPFEQQNLLLTEEHISTALSIFSYYALAYINL